MTVFSYIYSNTRGKQFREPKLLNELLARLGWISFSAGPNHWTGWVIHYLVGFLFVAVYYWLGIVKTFDDYLIAGTVCGIIGIAGWRTVFAIHPNPPVIRFREYYLQLLVAHVVFGIGAYLGDAST